MFNCLIIPFRQKNSTALSTKENPPNQSKPDKKKPVKIEEIEGHNVNMATHYDPHFVFRTTSVTCLYQRFHLHGYLQPAKKEETVVYIHEKPASPSPSTTSPASSSPSPSPSATSPASSSRSPSPPPPTQLSSAGVTTTECKEISEEDRYQIKKIIRTMLNNINKATVLWNISIGRLRTQEIDNFLNGKSKIRIELSNYHSIKSDTFTSFETILKKYPSHTLVTLKASELLPTWAATALKQAGKNPNKEKRLEVDWLQRGCSLLQKPTHYPPVEG